MTVYGKNPGQAHLNNFIGNHSINKIAVPKIIADATSLRICLNIGRCIISCIGEKSGSFKFLKNQSTPGRKTSRKRSINDAK